MEEHKFKSQTLLIKSALHDHQRAPGIVQINTLHFFPYSFRLMCTRYYCVLLVLPHSGVVEWNVRVSNFSLSVPNSTQCATLDTKLVMQGGYYLLME